MRKIFSEKQKEEIYDRDEGVCVVQGCMTEIQQFDHAFPKSLAMPRINESWNGSGICAFHHHNITHRLDQEDQLIRLQLLEKAIVRAKEELPDELYQRYYKEYHQKMVRYKYKYNIGDESVDILRYYDKIIVNE